VTGQPVLALAGAECTVRRLCEHSKGSSMGDHGHSIWLQPEKKPALWRRDLGVPGRVQGRAG